MLCRWPSRKIQAIDGVVEQLKAIAGDSIVEPFDGGMRVSQVQTKIGELLLLKSRIELGVLQPLRKALILAIPWYLKVCKMSDPELPLGIDMNKCAHHLN